MKTVPATKEQQEQQPGALSQSSTTRVSWQRSRNYAGGERRIARRIPTRSDSARAQRSAGAAAAARAAVSASTGAASLRGRASYEPNDI